MSIPSRLLEIVTHKREEVAARRAARPVVDLSDAPGLRDFLGALHTRTGAGPRQDHSPQPVRLIAEVKQASPSRGLLRPDFDPVALAETYADNGAACLSVLTDERFFRGHDRYLEEIRCRVSVPLLRKEFLLDCWQVDESRALGADAVLLIVAILSPERLHDLHARAAELGMATLVEVQTDEELEIALTLGAPLLGINNRNLHTFETSLETTERLAARALEHGERVLVSESGIFTAADVARVGRCGASAVLVGEALVRETDVGAKVRELSTVVPAHE